FAEVHLDRVHVPDSMVVGEVGAGWQQVTSELAYERSGPERFLSSFLLLGELINQTSINDWINDCAAAEIGSLAARLWALRELSLHVQHLLDEGHTPDVEAAMVKDGGTRLEQEVVEVARRAIADLPAVPPEPLASMLRSAQLAAPTFTLRGGTVEILRGIIAKEVGA
ncbi:MAG: acyl-CoA dehydrogenase family protein, partial [Gaiellales bacterium]